MDRIFRSADIMLPVREIDKNKWAVVACDQFTSEPEYWEEADRIVGEEPSTLRMILPEVYLEEGDQSAALADIQKAMNTYMEEGIMQVYRDALIYVERTDSTGKVREGLVGCIDLEAYRYEKGSTSMVRATEQTVVERIPPRMKVRRNAVIELPHIMLLIDDPKEAVIEPLKDSLDDMERLYDFELMMDGGHLKGYQLTDAQKENVYKELDKLGTKEAFDKRYGLQDQPVLLYAVGDGNHSLATAKECYEQLKMQYPEQDISDHPARYALVELVNLHSPALSFEAIHRILQHVDPGDLISSMTEELGLVKGEISGMQVFDLVIRGEKEVFSITRPCSKLTVGSIQHFLDQYLAKHEGTIDYIHGIDVIEKLSMEENSVGLILRDMHKEELFPTVILDGSLPRKTFSMGHARDKRYYMECRKIQHTT